MAKYEITSHDGSKWEITAPDDATQEQVLAYAQKQWGNKPTPEQEDMVDVPSRVGRGAMDPVTGIAQMLYNAVPESVQDLGTRADQFLYEKTGGVLGAQQPFNEAVSQSEAEYQQARRATGQEGVDFARMGGNILSTAPLAMMAPQMAAASLPARIGVGAAEGGLFGASQPVANAGDNFWQQKGQQAATGAAFGAAAAPVSGAVSRVIRPRTSQEAQTLMREGVTPTPGQVIGGSGPVGRMVKSLEEKARSIPIMGDLIASSQRRSIQELNRAAYNRALAPIGKNAKGFPVGREGVARVERELGKAYDEIIPKMSFKPDNVFNQEMSKIKQMIASLPEKQQKQFQNIMRDKLVNHMTPQGNMSGESLKAALSALRKEAKGYRKTPDYDAQKLGDAIGEVRNIIHNTLKRTNPGLRKRLQQIDQGWANFKILQRASSMQGAESGFSVGQLNSAVKAMDQSLQKGAFARGSANMQDLAGAARETLSQTVPNSGTADRLMLGAGALGAGAYSPAIPAGLAAGGIPYLPGVRNAVAGLLARRPEGAGLLADAVRQSSPAIGAASSPLFIGNE